jgi:hypothetical protein
LVDVEFCTGCTESRIVERHEGRRADAAQLPYRERISGLPPPSSKPGVFLQQGDHISDSLGVGFIGLELVAELDEIALSLALG